MNIKSIGSFFLTVLLVMVGIYVIKMVLAKVGNVPVLSKVAEAV